MKYERVTVTAGRDYNTQSRYEYVIQTLAAGPDNWTTLERKGGFKSSSQARRAGSLAAQAYL